MDGQRALKAGKVLCIGAGGLGSPAAMYLAAAGVGTIGIVDFDVVDTSNLQRQLLHSTPDVGRSKLASAKDRLNALNPNVHVETYETALSSENALDLFAPYDVILDGTDNFPTRYLVNDACVLLGKPNAYGSIFRFEGQASVFAAQDGPCYRCLYPEPPPPGLVPSCAEGGVLGVLPGIIGTIQATEAIKLIIGKGEPLIGRFLIYDALRMRFRELKLRKDPDCPVCGTHPTVTELIDYEQFCGVKPAAEAAAVTESITDDMQPRELKDRLDRGEPIVIVDVREPQEYQINRIEGSRLIPLGELPQRYEELDPNAAIVMQCKGHAVSAWCGVQERPEPGGRHPGLDRSSRSLPAQVLRDSPRLEGQSPGSGTVPPRSFFDRGDVLARISALSATAELRSVPLVRGQSPDEGTVPTRRDSPGRAVAIVVKSDQSGRI
jgi:molybdopterin/thiamine biosynthesis adenylyltransferase